MDGLLAGSIFVAVAVMVSLVIQCVAAKNRATKAEADRDEYRAAWGRAIDTGEALLKERDTARAEVEKWKRANDATIEYIGGLLRGDE